MERLKTKWADSRSLTQDELESLRYEYPNAKSMLLLDAIRGVAPAFYLVDLALKIAFLRRVRFVNEHVYEMYLSFLLARPFLIWVYHVFKVVGHS